MGYGEHTDMTILKNKLKRELEVYADHRGRHLIIELEAPGLITFREKGRRQRVTVTATWIYQQALKRMAEQALRERKAKRTKKGEMSI